MIWVKQGVFYKFSTIMNKSFGEICIFFFLCFIGVQLLKFWFKYRNEDQQL